MEKVLYKNKRLRIGIAFISSVYILFHGRSFDVLGAVISPFFYVALGISFIVSLLLVNTVHYVSVWLDKGYDWWTMPFERGIAQITLGVLVPLMIDFVLLSIYFNIIGQNIFENGFMRYDYPMIICFMIILNLYYLVHYLVVTKSEDAVYAGQNHGPALQESNLDIQPAALVIHYNGQHLIFNVKEDILYFYRSGKLVNLLTISGHVYQINDSIAKLNTLYQSEDFYLINRAVIINQGKLKGYLAGTKRDTLQALFKPKYHHLIKDQNSELFRVTKENISVFKERFSGNRP